MNTGAESGVRVVGQNAFETAFLCGAAVILTLTGLGKISGAFSNVRFLAIHDPVSGIQFRYLMIAVGAAEFGIAILCFFRQCRRLIAPTLIAWLATSFMIYRFGLWWSDWQRPCPCLGNITDALHISPHQADNITKVVLGYLIVGSYGLLFREWRERRKLIRPSPGVGGTGS